MTDIIGFALLLLGIVGMLYNWISEQKVRQKRIEEMIRFLQKSIFALGTEKVRIIDYFESYESRDEVLTETLHEIAFRLKENRYPEGQTVWEEVCREKKQNWNCDEETFGLIIHAGNGFFGRNRNENICFLQKSLRELEVQIVKNKEKDERERKVWVPVGMLGGIMVFILFV